MAKYIVSWKRNKNWARNMGYPINAKQSFSKKRHAEEWANQKRRSQTAHSVKIRKVK